MKNHERQIEETYYLLYPGSEKIDLGPRKPVTISRYRNNLDYDVNKYVPYGEVVTVKGKSELIKIIEAEW